MVLFWIVLALLGVAAAVFFWPWIPYLAAGVLVLCFTAWILISVLSPSRPDRTCPRCSEAGLVKIRRGVPGVRCERCGFRDEEMHVSYLDDW
jgi:DNA-directed RNA polymerase subunit RPC12/RpoP